MANMIILLKIEATLFLILLALVIFSWMVGNGCKDDNKKFSNLMLYFTKMGAFLLSLLLLCILVTIIWAF